MSLKKANLSFIYSLRVQILKVKITCQRLSKMRHHWVHSFCRVTTYDYIIQCKRVHNLSTAAPETEGIFNYWVLIFILYPDGHIYMELSFVSILLLASLTNKSSQTLKHYRCWKLIRVVANGHVLRSQLTGILITEFWLAPIQNGLSSTRSWLITCPLVRRKPWQPIGGGGYWKDHFSGPSLGQEERFMV